MIRTRGYSKRREAVSQVYAGSCSASCQIKSIRRKSVGTCVAVEGRRPFAPVTPCYLFAGASSTTVPFWVIKRPFVARVILGRSHSQDDDQLSHGSNCGGGVGDGVGSVVGVPVGVGTGVGMTVGADVGAVVGAELAVGVATGDDWQDITKGCCGTFAQTWPGGQSEFAMQIGRHSLTFCPVTVQIVSGGQGPSGSSPNVPGVQKHGASTRHKFPLSPPPQPTKPKSINPATKHNIRFLITIILSALVNRHLRRSTASS